MTSPFRPMGAPPWRLPEMPHDFKRLRIGVALFIAVPILTWGGLFALWWVAGWPGPICAIIATGILIRMLLGRKP